MASGADLDMLIAGLRDRLAGGPPLDHVARFDLGPAGIIRFDGTVAPPLITAGDGIADVTIRLDAEVLAGILDGTTDPGAAYSDGLIGVEGAVGVALQLGALFSE